MITVKDLKKGEFFTLVDVETPKESQVYVRGDYDRETKKYECHKWADVCSTRYFKGDKVVYTNLVF